MLIIGLTGNYGMGKSTVLSMFEKLGAITLDTDKIVESILQEKDVIEKIKELLGITVFNDNGKIDKNRVANLIFKNNNLKNSLENFLHPLVFKKIDNFLNQINDKNSIVIIEIPLLYEKGYEDRFDKTITVYTNKKTALDRLKKDGISNKNATQRMQSQLSIKDKKKRSNYVIDNNDRPELTMGQVKKIYNKLLQEVEFGDRQGFRKFK